jgi:hypothetical protein
MKAAKIAARSAAMLMGLMFVVAVSTAFADGLGGRFEENWTRSGATSVTSIHLTSGPIANFNFAGSNFGRTADAKFDVFADFKTNSISGDSESWIRTDGIRNGQWLSANFKNCDIPGTGPSNPSTAMPEPGTLLLLATGVGPLLFSRRRALKA